MIEINTELEAILSANNIKYTIHNGIYSFKLDGDIANIEIINDKIKFSCYNTISELNIILELTLEQLSKILHYAIMLNNTFKCLMIFLIISKILNKK